MCIFSIFTLFGMGTKAEQPRIDSKDLKKKFLMFTCLGDQSAKVNKVKKCKAKGEENKQRSVNRMPQCQEMPQVH